MVQTEAPHNGMLCNELLLTIQLLSGRATHIYIGRSEHLLHSFKTPMMYGDLMVEWSHWNTLTVLLNSCNLLYGVIFDLPLFLVLSTFVSIIVISRKACLLMICPKNNNLFHHTKPFYKRRGRGLHSGFKIVKTKWLVPFNMLKSVQWENYSN